MARPTKRNKRDQQLNLKLTAAELTWIKARAAGAGMRLVDYGRWILLREGAASPQATTPHDRLLYEQLKRLGNNLNQLARIANATREPPPAALDALLNDIRAIINRGAVQ